MRGALNPYILHKFGDGIIPAYAGSTLKTIVIMLKHWDHPRVCGEHSY